MQKVTGEDLAELANHYSWCTRERRSTVYILTTASFLSIVYKWLIYNYPNL